MRYNCCGRDEDGSLYKLDKFSFPKNPSTLPFPVVWEAGMVLLKQGHQSSDKKEAIKSSTSFFPLKTP